jgi:uncharacterized protein
MKRAYLAAFCLLVMGLVFAQTLAPVPTSAQIPHKAPKTIPNDWPNIVVMAGSPVGTGGYSVFVALSDAINKELGVPSQVIGGTTSAAAIRFMEKEQIIGGWIAGQDMLDAILGEGAFKGEPMKKVRTLCLMDAVPYPILTYPGSGVTRAADLKGKKWVVIRPGSKYTEDFANGICDANGFTRNDTTTLPWVSVVAIGDSLRSKVVHAIMWPCSPGSAFGEDLARSMKVTYIPLTEAETEAIKKRGPYLMVKILPPNSYYDQKEPLRVVCNPNFFAIGSTVPDSLIYELCHILMDDPKRFVAAHPTIGEFSFEPSFMEMPPQAPYHPGVIKYLKEKRLWNNQLQMWNDVALAKLPK